MNIIRNDYNYHEQPP